MKKTLFIILFLLSVSHYSIAQMFDMKTYSGLVKADKDEFIRFAESAGLKTNFDETSQTLFATGKACLYAKPLADKNNTEYYELVLIVSTPFKANIQKILQNATESTDTKGIWTDTEYLYKEWDMENPETKEMWYKVIVYRKKK